MNDTKLDARHLPAMLVNIAALLNSEFMIRSTGDECKAGLRLWCHAFHHVPAGSLPNDERLLAHFAGYGSNPRGWKKVRAMALRNFILGSDGLLHHSIVGRSALLALEITQRNTDRAKKAAAARWKKATKSTDDGCLSNARADAQAMQIEGKGKEGKEIKEQESVGSTSLPRETTTQEWLSVRKKVTDIFLAEGWPPPGDQLVIDTWAATGCKPDLTLLAIQAKAADMRNRRFVPRSIAMFADAVEAAHRMDERGNPRQPEPAKPMVTDERWAKRVAEFAATAKVSRGNAVSGWIAGWGPPPGFGGCRVPPEVLRVFGYPVPALKAVGGL